MNETICLSFMAFLTLFCYSKKGLSLTGFLFPCVQEPVLVVLLPKASFADPGNLDNVFIVDLES